MVESNGKIFEALERENGQDWFISRRKERDGRLGPRNLQEKYGCTAYCLVSAQIRLGSRPQLNFVSLFPLNIGNTRTLLFTIYLGTRTWILDVIVALTWTSHPRVFLCCFRSNQYPLSSLLPAQGCRFGYLKLEVHRPVYILNIGRPPFTGIGYLIITREIESLHPQVSDINKRNSISFSANSFVRLLGIIPHTPPRRYSDNLDFL